MNMNFIFEKKILMRTVFVLFLLLALAFPGRADVEIEYAVVPDKQLPQVLHFLLPQRILVGINTRGDVVVRGEKPSEDAHSYNLYPVGKPYWYQCEGNRAIQQPYSRATQVFYPDDPPVQIAGLLCRRAVSIIGKDTSDIYYTTSFGVDFCPTAEIRGFAMLFTRVIQGIPVLYQAQRFQACTLPSEWFDLSKLNIKRFRPGRPLDLDALEQKMSGRRAASISGTPVNRSPIKPKMLAGKVVVLSFWYSESMACLEQIPIMERMAARYAGRDNFVFLAVMPESDYLISRLLYRLKLQYSILPYGYDIAGSYRVRAYPTTVVIDKEGYIAEYIAGNTWDLEDRLEAVLQWAMKQERQAGVGR
ncbi:MAG TPA: TlpA disulfide reductase family protein [Saprospiraceae bacterium]|nr:TlpA disulfide reductase family protein [Saprospiraceae bacterium]